MIFSKQPLPKKPGTLMSLCLEETFDMDKRQFCLIPNLNGLSVLDYAHYWKDRIKFNNPYHSYHYFFCNNYNSFIKILQHLIATAPEETRIIFCTLFSVHYSCYVFEKWNNKSYLFSFDSVTGFKQNILGSLSTQERENLIYAIPASDRQSDAGCKFFAIRNCHHVNFLPPLYNLPLTKNILGEYSFNIPHRMLEDAQLKSKIPKQALVSKQGIFYSLEKKITKGVRYNKLKCTASGISHNLAIPYFKEKYSDALIERFNSGQTLTIEQITAACHQGAFLNGKKALHLSNILKALSDEQMKSFLQSQDANQLLSLNSEQMKSFLYRPNPYTLRPDQLYLFEAPAAPQLGMAAMASALLFAMPPIISPRPAPGGSAHS